MYLEDQAVLEHQVGQGAAEHEERGESQAPHGDDAVRLRQLQELCDLEACQVVHREEGAQRLQNTHTSTESQLQALMGLTAAKMEEKGGTVNPRYKTDKRFLLCEKLKFLAHVREKCC